ncbi:MAG: 2-C-methyl-D-erythritol 4-phosphate cytidylyltransferase [Odoribacter sp.]|nr:2-C-methyl-D-erythritol 4-phosphate cytidylyltransferase [Odoribacter sp.]
MRNIGVILAGGLGSRIGGELPKQFHKLNGKTILEMSVSKFDIHPLIDEIVVVVHPDYLSLAEKVLENTAKLTHVVIGGKERYHSTLAALAIYQDIPCNLIIHDAARPLVTDRIITEVIEALQEYKAVNVAIPASDTIIEVNPVSGLITGLPDRKTLYHVQTPQGFYVDVLKTAFEKGMQDENFQPTDDCGIVKKYLPEENIKIVAGDKNNIKVTYASDLLIIEQLLKKSIQ